MSRASRRNAPILLLRGGVGEATNRDIMPRALCGSMACAVVESHLGSPGRGVLKPEKEVLIMTGSFALVLAHYGVR